MSSSMVTVVDRLSRALREHGAHNLFAEGSSSRTVLSTFVMVGTCWTLFKRWLEFYGVLIWTLPFLSLQTRLRHWARCIGKIDLQRLGNRQFVRKTKAYGFGFPNQNQDSAALDRATRLVSGDMRLEWSLQEKYALLLYQHVTSRVDLQNRSVVEVSCGRGGGAYLICLTRHPRRYVGLDSCRQNIELNTKLFVRRNVHFLQFEFSDAYTDWMPIDRSSVEVVLGVLPVAEGFWNAEGLIKDAFRVLKPEGQLVWVDMARPNDGDLFALWKKIALATGYELVYEKDLTAGSQLAHQRCEPSIRTMLEQMGYSWCVRRILQQLFARRCAIQPSARMQLLVFKKKIED